MTGPIRESACVLSAFLIAAGLLAASSAHAGSFLTDVPSLG